MLDVKTLWNFYTTARSGIIRLLRGSMVEKYAQEHKNDSTWLHWEIEYFGHYHANRDYGKVSEYGGNGETIMLFYEVREIL